MAEDTSKYTHVGVLKPTHKMIAILATVADGGQGVNMYELVDVWAKTAWQEAKDAGLVTDAMLPIAMDIPLVPMSQRVASMKKPLSKRAVTKGA